MDTSSKNKNKWRWFIGIIVGIAVALGACIAMQYILAAKEAVGESAWTETMTEKEEIICGYVNLRGIRLW